MMAEFNPLVETPSADIVGTGVRVGTAAAVLSMVYSAPPSKGLIENLRNPELLAVWPLRDPESMDAIAVLSAAPDHSWNLHAQWHELFGYADGIPLLSTKDSPELRAFLQAYATRFAFTSPSISHLPLTHLASLLGLTGHLATHLAQAARSGSDVVPAGHAIADTAAILSPLIHEVTTAVDASSTSETFQAIGKLTGSYDTHLLAFAHACAHEESPL